MSSDALRPKSWDDYIGQKKMKERLQIHINAAIERGDILEHVLLLGPAGVGKTSLARLICQELMVPMQSFVMPVRIKNLRKAIIEACENEDGVAIFLDELHRLPPREQEWFLPVMEDRYIQLDDGEKLHLPGQLTIIGATTEQRKVIVPLQDRFAIKPAFEEYSDEEMAQIFSRMAERVGLKPTPEEAFILGQASCGIPRQARTIVFTARDLDTCDPKKVLAVCGITPEGLTEAHVLYLSTIDKLGMIAGVDLLCNQLRLPKEMILDLERVLVHKQYIQYSPKGRELTLAGRHIVKREANK